MNYYNYLKYKEKKNNLIDFNYNIYINNYSDLHNMNKEEAISHYIQFGKDEDRTYKIDISNFNYDIYINNYSDLQNMNKEEALKHYINYGYSENRTYLFNINDFNYLEYINNYDDLIYLNYNDALNHYIKYGISENRTYKTNNLADFNYLIYIKNFNDILNEYDAKLHYIRYGKYENRIYNYNHKINYIDYIFWINLNKSKDRYDNMIKLFEDIKISNIRIEAIDGTDDNLINKYKNKFDIINKFEIACLLSHIKAISYIKKYDGNYFMICEDDIAFDNLLLFYNNLSNITLETIIKNAPVFDILLIYKTYNKKLSDIYTDWNIAYNNNKHIAGTVAYIINKNSIDKILNLINYDEIKNIFNINVNNITPADYFLYKNCKTYVYKYNFINCLNQTSIIHKDHLKHHIEFSDIQKNIILDDIKS
jgi:GR25 family glycosyltransferase involved in LPS biosynthesis